MVRSIRLHRENLSVQGYRYTCMCLYFTHLNNYKRVSRMLKSSIKKGPIPDQNDSTNCAKENNCSNRNQKRHGEVAQEMVFGCW